jgi:hypothetical protein
MSTLPLRLTEIFDLFWQYVVERQTILERRLRGLPPPWTSNPVLERYKFTNCWRATDFISQFLIREVIPDGSSDPEEVFFRIFLYKIFNTVTAWKVLTAALGETPSWENFDFKSFDRALDKAKAQGLQIWSAAYMQKPQCFEELGKEKHRRYLGLVRYAMEQHTAEKLALATSYEECFRIFRTLPIHGDFLSQQHLTDCNYSGLINYDEDDFYRAGPGSLGGINKCFSLHLDPAREQDMQTAARLVRMMVDKQESCFAKLGLKPVTLYGRRLKLIDVGNVFCEIDKLSRVTHPQYNAKRTQIKRTYNLAKAKRLPPLVMPAKWGIALPNDQQHEEEHSSRDGDNGIEE